MNNKKNSNKFKKKGSALMMTVILLSSMMLVIFIFFESIDTSIKSSKSNKNSIQSYYAAESGIEEFLFYTLVNATPLPSTLGEIFSGTLNNGGNYSVRCVQLSPVRIKSFGLFNDSYRSVELDF